MAVIETDNGPAKVWRNIDPDREPFASGTVPPWDYGRWFVHCETCGPVKGGHFGWHSSPVTAEKIADRHNADRHANR